jgi:6-phosphogluconolactonase
LLREIVIAPPPVLAAAFAARLAEVARHAEAVRGRLAIGMSGGSVATEFLPALATSPLDPTSLDVFWIDERAVPPEDPESNYGLAARLWLDPAAVPPSGRHRMRAEQPDLAAAAAAYEAELVGVLGDPPRLDVALVGMGPDGHVASLFHGHPSLREERRLVLAIEDSPKPPPRRLTLTLPLLARSALVVVAAFGEAKAAALAEALRDAGSQLPLALLIRRAPRLLLLLDRSAAAGIASLLPSA